MTVPSCRVCGRPGYFKPGLWMHGGYSVYLDHDFALAHETAPAISEDTGAVLHRLAAQFDYDNARLVHLANEIVALREQVAELEAQLEIEAVEARTPRSRFRGHE